MTRRRQHGLGRSPERDDAGGVWIVTGWVVGLLLWGGVLLTWHAGFTAAAPFAVIPVVLFILIGAGNLLAGRPRRAPPQFNRPEPIPVHPRPDAAAAADGGVPSAGGADDPGTGDGPRR